MAQRVGIGRPLLHVWMWAIPVGAYSCLALLKPYAPFNSLPAFPHDLDAALSFAMALIIAFRVNRAYERWWEARTLWGKLVNVSRNLAVKVRELPVIDVEGRHTARNLIIAFAEGLKNHLLDEPALNRLTDSQASDARPVHVPSYIVVQLYRLLNQWRTEGRLTDQQLWMIDSEAREFLEVCGGCEKIKTTLMSVSWRLFARQCIAAYLVVLPWGLVDDFRGWTIPFTMIIAYFVIAGECIAQYVEEPFGVHEDHLDLKSICATIDRSVSEVLIETVPPV